MQEILAATGGIIAPVFLCAALGFFWARRKLPFDMKTVTALSTDVGTPCLVVVTLSGLSIPAGAFADMAAASFASFAVTGGGGLILLSLLGRDIKAYLPILMFSNFGNMGLPLCLFAFGEQGLGYAVVFSSVGVVMMFTVGNGLASGRFSPGRLFRTPALYAVLLGSLLQFGGISLPGPLFNTLKLLGDMTIPLMLFALGVSLADLRPSRLAWPAILSLLRLAGGLGTGLLLAELFAMEGMMRGVLIIQTSLPVAVFIYLFAARYQREPEDVAGAVMLSTLLSFLTLPGLLYVAGATG